MTVRATIEMVPFGEDEEKFPIFTVEVFQTKSHKGDLKDYGYKIFEHNNNIPEGQAGKTLQVGAGYVLRHHQRKGALELFRRVLESHILHI